MSLSSSDDGINSLLSEQAILVFDIFLFSFFTFCKFLLNGGNFKYLYDIFKIQSFQTRTSSIILFCAVVMPFFLTVITSAVMWSYMICTATSSSPGDMIVHLDSNKNRSMPSPPGAADAPSLSLDIYLVSSYHFMCVCVCHAADIFTLKFTRYIAAHYQPSCLPAAWSAYSVCVCGSAKPIGRVCPLLPAMQSISELASRISTFCSFSWLSSAL
jgi:hypothetical protein